MSFTVTCVVKDDRLLRGNEAAVLLVWINLFAFGGLEAVFFCPTLSDSGKRANSTGAILSMLSGCAAFSGSTSQRRA